MNKLEDLSIELSKYGNLEVIKEGSVFTVFITGTGLAGWRTISEIQKLINNYTSEYYPTIEIFNTSETHFLLILKPKANL